MWVGVRGGKVILMSAPGPCLESLVIGQGPCARQLPFLLAKVATHLSTNIRSILAKTFNVLMLNVPSLPTVQNYICTKKDPLFSS